MLIGLSQKLSIDCLTSAGLLAPASWGLDESSEGVSLSRVQLFVTPWMVAHQAPLSMEFSRWEYWSGLAFPDPGIEPRSLQLQADSFLSEPPGKPQGLDTQPLSSAYLHEELMFCFWLMKISTWILLFSKEYADSPFHT